MQTPEPANPVTPYDTQPTLFESNPAYPSYSSACELIHRQLVVVGHYFIWHARVLTDVDTGAVVSGQQVTVKGEHMNVAQKSVMVLCQQVDRSPG